MTIKTKKIELEKLQNTINNATVKAEITGTVQSLKTVEQLQSDGTDVLMKIMSDGEFRVKCTISEQNIQSIYQDEPMVLRSRVDDSLERHHFGDLHRGGQQPEQQHDVRQQR